MRYCHCDAEQQFHRHPGVFCIGFHPTGTGWMHLALGGIGITSAREGSIEDSAKAGRPVKTGLEQDRAVSDWNRPETHHLFVQSDEPYPGSKSILAPCDLGGGMRSGYPRIVASEQDREHRSDSLIIDRGARIQANHERRRAVHEHIADLLEDLLEQGAPQGDGRHHVRPFPGAPETPFPRKRKSPNPALRTVLSGRHQVSR